MHLFSTLSGIVASIMKCNFINSIICNFITCSWLKGHPRRINLCSVEMHLFNKCFYSNKCNCRRVPSLSSLPFSQPVCGLLVMSLAETKYLNLSSLYIPLTPPTFCLLRLATTKSVFFTQTFRPFSSNAVVTASKSLIDLVILPLALSQPQLILHLMHAVSFFLKPRLLL